MFKHARILIVDDEAANVEILTRLLERSGFGRIESTCDPHEAAALYVKYRDITHMWELVLQAAFYATPILYPMSLVINESELVAKLMMLNPMAQIIQDARYVLVTPETTIISDLISNPLIALIPILIVFVTIIGAAHYFRKSSKYFAEDV